MAKNETAKATIYLDGKQAEAALDGLKAKATQLKEAFKQAQQAGDQVKMDKLAKEIKTVDSSIASLRKETFDYEKVLKNLNGSSLKDLKAALRTVQVQMNGMKRTDPGYAQMQANAKRLNTEIRTVNRSMYEQQGVTGKLVGLAKGLLPAFSFALIASLAKQAFDKVVSSTDYLSDKWDEVMGGMTAATNYFWTTLAEGNWENFFSNLREAARLGAEYAKTLDELGDRNRSLSIEEANAKQKILDLEIRLKNRTLTEDERLAAGKERIKLEEDLSAARTRNAKLAYENELNNNIKFKQFSKEQVMQIMTDLDSENRKDADVFAEKARRLDDLTKKKGIAGALTGGAALLFSSDEARQLSEELKNTPDNVKQYGSLIYKFQQITDEEKDKLVKTYVELKDAENSAVENTKKVRNQVNTLLAGEQKDRQNYTKTQAKEADKEREILLKKLDEAYQERQLTIEKHHLEERDTDANFKANLAAAERAYLEQKMAILEQYGESTIEIQRKLIEKDLELLKQAEEEMLAQQEEIVNQFNEKRDSEFQAEQDALNKSVDENIQAGENALQQLEDQKNRELEIVKERRQAYVEMAGAVGESLGNLLTDSEASFGDFLRNSLVMALEYLEKIALLKTTEALIEGTVKGPLGVVGAIAKIIAIKAAFAVAKNMIMSGGKKESKRGYAEGGYTGDGSTYEPAGVVHRGEWVAPQAMVKDSRYSGVISFLESQRRAGNFYKVSVPAITPSARGYASGGYVAPVPSVPGESGPIPASHASDLAAAINRLMTWQPAVSVETFEMKKQIYDSIQKNRNL